MREGLRILPLQQRLSMWPSDAMLSKKLSDDRSIAPYFGPDDEIGCKLVDLGNACFNDKQFTSDIQTYLRQQHNIRVGEPSAEAIKWAVGAVLTNLEEAPEPFTVHGPNLMTAHPVEATITYQEMASCLDKSIMRIEASILHVLEQTPPELYSDIVENGIFLSGGGALLRGLDKRLTEKVNIPFHVAEDPLHAVARGTCIALKHIGNCSFLKR